MIPQIQAIQDATDDEKVQLVEAGLALIAPGGELFLSLEAVNSIGLKVMEQDPVVMVGMDCIENGTVATGVIIPGENANTTINNLVENLYGTLEYAAVHGIPLYPAFRHYMAQEERDRHCVIDYTNVLLTAQQQMRAMLEAKAAQARVAQAGKESPAV